MSRSSFRFASFAFVTLAAVACSSGGGGGGPSGPATATVPKNVHWCTDPAPEGCGAINVCGTCLAPPTADLVRTNDTKEYKGSGPVDVSCFDKAKPPAPVGASKPVKMRGYVRIFANGPDSKNVKIDVYEEQLDASGAPTGQLGKLVGSTTSSDKIDGLPLKTEEKVKSGTVTTRTLYAYELDGVPTEKPLIVKTSDAVPDAGWFALYDYNVAARNDQLTGDAFVFDVRALGNDDYASILKAAYNRPPEGGQSAIAGEVHDCGDVRVSNATVAIQPRSSLPLFYLSEVEDNPLPDADRKSTGKLGLYAVGGLKPGVHTVAAVGRLGGELVALGSYRVQTFTDSVTVYTFRGIRPWQIKK